MSNIYFTSDTHYHHKKIIEHSERPFKDMDEMNEMMIHNWNSIVKPGDLVYHLGDFSFGTTEQATSIARRLAGQKYLVFGNHDKRLRKERDFLAQWIWAKDFAEIKVGDQKVVLCHYAMMTWNQSHRGSWNLHGHSHGSLPESTNALRVDVGVDCWDYTPVHYDTLAKHMSTKTFKPMDHHGKRDDEDYGL